MNGRERPSLALLKRVVPEASSRPGFLTTAAPRDTTPTFHGAQGVLWGKPPTRFQEEAIQSRQAGFLVVLSA
jgi:hypothetical protein